MKLPLMFICSALSAADPGAIFRECDWPDVPGVSVMAIGNGKVLYKHAFGLADIERHIRATTKTNYRLASVTKQFTAMSIMMLAERGKLSFDQSLAGIIPGLPARITIRHLLNHTSGLADYEDGATTFQLNDHHVLEILRKKDSTLFEPGAKFSYSNSGYAVLALVVEKHSAMTFAEFLTKNIFAPLKMSATVAHQEGVDKVRDRAYGHSKDGDKFKRTDQSLTSAVLGDGGIYSSVEDLCKWDAALWTNRLVSAGTWRQAVTAGANTAYGFGWEIASYKGRTVWRHSGSTIGFRTHITRFPRERLTVIVLLNRADLDAQALALAVADMFL
jgi:CubicO group peptidase (beta-lactamase class C family)